MKKEQQKPVRIELSKNGKPLFFFNFRPLTRNKYSPTGISCRETKLKKKNE